MISVLADSITLLAKEEAHCRQGANAAQGLKTPSMVLSKV